MLDKIDAHQHEKELKVQEKLKASERKLEKAKKAGNAEDEEKHADASSDSRAARLPVTPSPGRLRLAVTQFRLAQATSSG